jgi:hypothetical protein
VKTEKKNWKLFLISLVFLVPSFLLASYAVLYAVLYLFPDYTSLSYNSPIHVSFIRGYSFAEIKETPFPYLCSISIVSALVAAFWTAFILPGAKFKAIKIMFAPWVAVLFTGPVWGLIWSMNRWPAEKFQSYETLMLFRKSDITSGLNLSFLSAVQSFPINLISYVVFCGLLYASMRFFKQNNQ